MGNKSTQRNHIMGNTTDSEPPTKKSKHNDSNSITSTAKSMFGGVKSYLFGSSKTEQHEQSEHAKYRNSAVFVQLSAPNYYFANQGLQWVKDTMYYDEEGDGYHIAIGPLS